ncbi:MAG TPA: hypothetical protein VGB37_15135 [Candidatus Lokiarchaeia archaeon]
MKEYWKITHLKKYLKILEKEDKLECNVTRSEKEDVKMKIKIMEEVEKHYQNKFKDTDKLKKILAEKDLKELEKKEKSKKGHDIIFIKNYIESLTKIAKEIKEEEEAIARLETLPDNLKLAIG